MTLEFDRKVTEEKSANSNLLFIFYADNGGNTQSNVPGARGMDVKKGHPKWEFVQDWRKWAGEQPPTNNAPLREGKGRIYEGGQRVPLMVRWPEKVAASYVSDAIVDPIDLYPTILEAVGLTAPADQIVPKPNPNFDSAASKSPNSTFPLRRRRWKYNRSNSWTRAAGKKRGTSQE